jgi:hypothetical protein
MADGPQHSSNQLLLKPFISSGIEDTRDAAHIVFLSLYDLG